MAMIRLPRLYVNGKFSRIIHPVNVSITENIIPMSSASITLREGEELPVRSWVELFTPYGSAGMFRVRAPRDGYGQDDSAAELEHMIAEVGDYVVRDDISKMMPAKTAVETFFKHYRGGKWKLGKYSDLGSGNVAVEIKYDSVLTAILSVMDQKPECMMKFDFTTSPWTLNIVKRGTKVVSQGRLARNVQGAQISYDESTIVTRVWYQTWSQDKDGNVTGTWHSKDADTLKQYGIVERRLDTTVNMTWSEINYMVDSYLKAHKNPRTSVSIKASELYRITKEKVDRFIIGDLFRLALVKYKLTVDLNITSVIWQDVYGDPENVIINLGEEEDTVVSFLHNLDATGAGISGGAGGGGGAGRSAKKNSEYDTQWRVYEDHIDGFSKKLDEHGEVLKQAGLQINPDGVLIYADNGSKNTLYSKFKVTNDAITAEVTNREKLQKTMTSKITQQADKISLVVEEKDGDNVIKAASIVTAINADGSSIKLDADRIHLEGYVTAHDLEVVNGRVSNLISGQAAFTKVVTAQLNATSFHYSGADISLQTVTINGTTIHYLGW